MRLVRGFYWQEKFGLVDYRLCSFRLDCLISPIILECWVVVDVAAVVRPGANLVELFYMFGTVQTSVCVADFAPLRLVHLVAN